MKKNPKLLWIVGFLMVAAGLYLVISTITPPGYQKAAGTILNVDEAASVPSYEREIQFTTGDGQTYIAHNRQYSNGKQMSSEVTVAYNPDNPQNTMRVISDSGRSMVWGIVVVAIGAGLVYLGFRKPPSSDETYNDEQNPPRPMRTKKSPKK